MILKQGPKTCINFDNLRMTMRELYYALAAENIRATHILSGQTALCGYEWLSNKNDPPVTMFKDVPVKFDRSMRPDEMRFYQGGELVGEIRNIS